MQLKKGGINERFRDGEFPSYQEITQPGSCSVVDYECFFLFLSFLNTDFPQKSEFGRKVLKSLDNNPGESLFTHFEAAHRSISKKNHAPATLENGYDQRCELRQKLMQEKEDRNPMSAIPEPAGQIPYGYRLR